MADAHPCSILVAIVYSLWLCSFFPPDYKYLKYVNLGQFATRLKKFAIGCLAWSIVPIVTVFIPPESDHHSWVNSVPDAVWYIGLMASLTWWLRGQKLEFPVLNAEQWVVLNSIVVVVAGTFALSNYYLPQAGIASVFIVIWKSLEMFVSLAEIGKDNYDHVS